MTLRPSSRVTTGAVIHFAFLPLPFHRAVNLPPTSTIFAPDGTGRVVVFLKTCPIVGTPYLMPPGRYFSGVGPTRRQAVRSVRRFWEGMYGIHSFWDAPTR